MKTIAVLTFAILIAVTFMLWPGVAFAQSSQNPSQTFPRPFRTVKLKTDIRFICFSPDLKQFAVIKSEANEIEDNAAADVQLWDWKTGKLQRTLKGHAHTPQELAFSRNGKILASASNDEFRVWNTHTGKLISSFHLHNRVHFTHMALSPGGHRVALSASEEPYFLWDVHSGRPIGARYPRFTTSLSFAPDGKTYIVPYNGAIQDGRRDMDVTNVATGKIFAKFHYIGNIHTTLFSRDGKSVISAGDATPALAQVSIWDIKTKKLKRVIQWKGQAVRAMALSSDGSTLATTTASNRDKMIRLWNLKSGKLIKVLKDYQRSAINLSFSPDGKVLITGSRDGTINAWRVN